MILELSLLAMLSVTALAVVAWREGAGWDRIFRAGPVLLVPVVLLCSAISYNSCASETECGEQWWRMVPAYVIFALGVLWLGALLKLHGNRDLYWYYAILFAPGFFLFCMLQGAVAVRFPL
jgi:hypothetical protein